MEAVRAEVPLGCFDRVAVAFHAVRRARIGLGGVAATPVRARQTEAALEGRPWTVETVHAAADVLQGEGTPLDDHRASAADRRAVLGTSLPRLYAETSPRQEASA